MILQLFLALLFAIPFFAFGLVRMNPLNHYRHGVGAALELLDRAIGLPLIRGRWLVVDPYAINRDYINGDVYPDLASAYDQVVDGRGDGIAVMSGGTGASALTTSYLQKTLVWAKNAVTVIGVSSGAGYVGRARVASANAMTAETTIATPTSSTMTRTAGSFLTDGVVAGASYTIAASQNNGVTFTVLTVTAQLITATATPFGVYTAGQMVSTVLTPYMTELITVSGANNVFYNINFTNACLSTLALGAVSVTGNRNHFVNCHFNGGDNTSRAAQTTDYDLTLNASECVFDGCYLGNNNQIRAALNGNLVLGVSTGQIGQNFFNECTFLSYSVTTTRGAILITDAATLGGWIHFSRCKFVNWNSAKTAIAVSIVGATPNNWGLLFDNCSWVGYTAIGVNNHSWYTTPYASAVGTVGLGSTLA